MKPLIYIRIIVCLAAAGLSYSSSAQSADEVRTLFPGEQLVVKNQSIHYKLKLKDGQPYAESKETEELLFLSSSSASLSHYTFFHSDFHQLQDYEAYTISTEGKKTPVKDFKTSQSVSRSVFYDDVKQTDFDFPSVTPGSVGHLEYSILHNNPRMLSPHYFSRYVPVLNGELKITFPKEMSVKYILRGNQQDKVQFTSETRKGEITYTFHVSNLPKELSYPDSPDNSYYSLHIIFYIESYQDENKSRVNYMASLDDLYHLDWGFIKDINKDIGPELKHITDSLTRDVASMEEKVKRIYQWVQKNIKYVAFEQGMEGFVPRDANLVCNRRFGDCKDMSSILTLMLQHAGAPAYYTWIGSRALPYDYTDVALPITDNHMITTVKLDTGYIFLDGTDSYCVFGMPSGHIQGKQALIAISENEYKVIRVPILEKEKNMMVDSTILDLTDKGIRGTTSVNMTGYYAMDMHSVMSFINDKDKEKYMKEFFNRGSNKFKLDGYHADNTGNLNVYRLTGQFELQDYDKKIADEWYLNLNLFKFYEHEEIDYPRRQSPIEHDFKNVRKYVTVLNIPEGYKVSYLPSGKSFHNDVWGFDITYEQKKNQVIMTQSFENNYLLLPVEKFAAWNKVLENLFPLYKETISLSK